MEKTSHYSSMSSEQREMLIESFLYPGCDYNLILVQLAKLTDVELHQKWLDEFKNIKK